MLKQYVSTRIKHAPLSDIQSVENNLVTFKQGKNWKGFIAHSVSVTENGKQTMAGMAVNQSVDLTLQLSREDLMAMFVPSIVSVYTSQNEWIVLGDMENPLKPQTSRNLIAGGTIAYERIFPAFNM